MYPFKNNRFQIVICKFLVICGQFLNSLRKVTQKKNQTNNKKKKHRFVRKLEFVQQDSKVFYNRKNSNSGIPNISFWLQKEMEMLLPNNGFSVFRNIP